MKTLTRANSILFLLILGCITGFAQDAKPSAESRVPGLVEVIESEKLEHSSYSNSYFGLRLTIPEGWEVQDDSVKKAIMERGRQLIKADDAQKQAQLDQSVSNTAILLTLLKTPVVPENRASLMVAIERIPNYPSYTPVRYLTNLKTILANYSKVKVTVEKDIRSEMVNGVPFVALDVLSLNERLRFHQKYFCRLQQGYALCFIETYESEPQLAALNNLLAGLSIK
ncbi:MAG: hypothetical protein ABR501_09650 [Pyrinomonadaceae bacterium]